MSSTNDDNHHHEENADLWALLEKSKERLEKRKSQLLRDVRYEMRTSMRSSSTFSSMRSSIRRSNINIRSSSYNDDYDDSTLVGQQSSVSAATIPTTTSKDNDGDEENDDTNNAEEETTMREMVSRTRSKSIRKILNSQEESLRYLLSKSKERIGATRTDGTVSVRKLPTEALQEDNDDDNVDVDGDKFDGQGLYTKLTTLMEGGDGGDEGEYINNDKECDDDIDKNIDIVGSNIRKELLKLSDTERQLLIAMIVTEQAAKAGKDVFLVDTVGWDVAQEAEKDNNNNNNNNDTANSNEKISLFDVVVQKWNEFAKDVTNALVDDQTSFDDDDDDEHEKQQKEYVIEVNVISASDLLNTDMAFIGGKSDPYVEVYVEDTGASVNNFMQRTKTIQNNLNPIWNETISFHVNKIPSIIGFIVMDENKYTNDDYLGLHEFDMTSFFVNSKNNAEHKEEDTTTTATTTTTTTTATSLQKELKLVLDDETNLVKGSLKVEIKCNKTTPSTDDTSATTTTAAPAEKPTLAI